MDIKATLAEAWAVVQEAFAWASAQTGFPTGTIFIIVASLVTLYFFAKLFRPKEK
jgi:hypothetical protein